MPVTISLVPSVSRRMRVPSRAAWLGARAANVMRRRARLLMWWTMGSVGFFGLYLVLPAGQVGLSGVAVKALPVHRDTVLLVAANNAAARALSLADSVLTVARMPSALTTAPVAATNSVANAVAPRLAHLLDVLQRADNAPLPENFRALGDALADDPRARATLDSLLDVARDREELAGGVAVDPVFVALTTRVNALGRSLQIYGEERVRTLRLAATRPQVPAAPVAVNAVPPQGVIDTLPALEIRAAAWARATAATQALRGVRLHNAIADSVIQATESGARLASWPVLATASCVVAGVLSFLAMLGSEMRRPNVADAAEAERETTVRVLTLVGVRDVPPERSRREVDKQLTVGLDPTADAYRIITWHLATQWPREGIATVASSHPTVAAVVAANVAAALAVDARATLLIDADFESEPVRRMLDMPRSPGLAAVLENKRRWSESLVPVQVGRSRTMDVLPSGRRERALGPSESSALVAEIGKAARRYDATIVASSLELAERTRAGDDVVVCAIRGHTRVADLARSVRTLIHNGARVRGIVLWDGPVPPLAQGVE